MTKLISLDTIPACSGGCHAFVVGQLQWPNADKISVAYLLR